MAAKLGRMEICFVRLLAINKATQPFAHMVLQHHMTNKNDYLHYHSTYDHQIWLDDILP